MGKKKSKEKEPLSSLHGEEDEFVSFEYDEDTTGYPCLVIVPKQDVDMGSQWFPVFGKVEQKGESQFVAVLFGVVQNAEGSLGIPKDNTNPRVSKPLPSHRRAANFVKMMLAGTRRMGLLDPTIVEEVRKEFNEWSIHTMKDMSDEVEMEEEKPASPDADDEHDNVVPIGSARAGNNHG